MLDTLTGVIVILVVSIVGIIAVSVYGLYIEDKLLNRVESLEVNLKKIASDVKNGIPTDSVKTSSSEPTDSSLGIQSNGNQVQELLDTIAVNKARLEEIEKELATSNARIHILANLQSASSQQVNDPASPETNEIEGLRKEITEMKKQVDLFEKENASKIGLTEEL